MGLDEKALRREGFAGGRPIRLADGQEWAIPEPYVRLFPAVTEGGSIELFQRVTFGPEDDAELESIFDPQADPFASLRAQTVLAARLLLRNYALDNAALAALLPRDPKLEGNAEMWRELVEHMAGQAPKASPDGSESAS